MAQETQAPPDPGQAEQLADQLTTLADALHARLLLALRQRARAPQPDQVLTLAQAQALFDDEVALRQQAYALYATAVTDVAAAWPVPQAQLNGAIGAASACIAHITLVQDGAAVVLAVLLLASAVAGGKAETAVNALVKLERQLAKLQADRAPGAAT